MKKLTRGFMAIFFVIAMLLTSVNLNVIKAETSGPTLKSNVSSKILPYIYYNGVMTRLERGGTTILPSSNDSFFYLYFLPSKGQIDESSLEVSIDGKKATNFGSWVDSGAYRYIPVYLPTSVKDDSIITVNIKSTLNYCVRTRKITTESDTAALEN